MDKTTTKIEHLYHVLGLVGTEESVKYGEHIIDLLLVNRDPLDILEQEYYGCTGIFIPSQRNSPLN